MAYVDSRYIQLIQDTIYENTAAQQEGARSVALAIINAIEQGITAGLKDADEYVELVEHDIRSDLSESMNTLTDWTRIELDRIIDTFGPALTQALTALADSNIIGQQTTVDNLHSSYESVRESNELVGESVKETIVTSSQAIQDTHKEVGTHMESVLASAALGLQENQQLIQESLEAHNKTLFETILGVVQSITQLPKTLFNFATDMFLPIFGIVLNDVLNAVILGNPLTKLLGIAAEMFRDMVTELVEVDEQDLVNWVKKFQDMFTSHLTDVLGKGG